MRTQAPTTGTIAQATRETARALAEAGLPEAASEARWLMGAALGLSAAALVSRSDDMLTPPQTERVSAFLARRVCHEPLSRIVGARAFYGRIFRVTPATLDPRADTETLITAALSLLGGAGDRRLRILDIGTGTGCIVLTLLAELSNATGVATDVSEAALAVAHDNAQRLGLATRVTFARADLAEGIEGPFDVLVSNPPYIRTGDLAGLSPAVHNFDPHLALDGGADGLAFYRRIAHALPRLLPDGLVLLETGHDQAVEVARLLCATHPDEIAEPQIFNDVAGIPRVVAARTRSLR